MSERSTAEMDQKPPGFTLPRLGLWRRNADFDPGSAARSGYDGELATHQADSFLHADQSQTTLSPNRVADEAAAVIGDRQHDLPVAAPERHAHVSRLRMFADVP
jgi:hypothetical protein